jgi:hypothetical protein
MDGKSKEIPNCAAVAAQFGYEKNTSGRLVG